MNPSFYLVGGAVRDMVMGMNPKDRDFVVVGADVAWMEANGYVKVGADFPVFLKDGDEYALARTEEKTGSGYLGFDTRFGPEVTLEDDLSRRDLTINAMAMGTDGNVVDPFGGKTDLENKVLRHVSVAFADDPVRVLRLARFRARLGSGWTVAPETVDLVYQMGRKGVLNELTAERVWKEMERALMEKEPRLFFDTLLNAGVLKVLFPEVYDLKSALENPIWHPEGDAYEHTMLVLTAASRMGFDLTSRFAALTHDFGKGLTPKADLPKHYGHDVNGVPVVRDFANRLKVPTDVRDAAMFATRYHMYAHQMGFLTGKAWVKMLDAAGAKHSETKVAVLVNVMKADSRGRLGFENVDVSGKDMVFDYVDAYKKVEFKDVFKTQPTGPSAGDKIKQGMFAARVRAVNEVVRRNK